MYANILIGLYTGGLVVGGGGIYPELTLFVSPVLRLRNYNWSKNILRRYFGLI